MEQAKGGFYNTEVTVKQARSALDQLESDMIIRRSS